MVKRVEISKVTADQVRAMFPKCVVVANQFREVFGKGTKLVYAKEGGNEIGERLVGPERSICVNRMILNPTNDEESIDER